MVSWIWILPVILFCYCLIKNWIWKPWKLIQACQKQGISGYPFVPLFGQLLQISKTLRWTGSGSGSDWQALRTAQLSVKKHGKVFYFTTGKTVRVVIADPDLLREVLSDNSDSYAKPSFIHVLDILGDGLFVSSGQVWADQRQLLGLSFASKEIKTDVGIMTGVAHTCLDKWLLDAQKASGELEIYHKLLELTITVITKLAFGAELDSQGKSSPRVVTRAFERYLTNCRELVFGPPAAIPGYRLLPTSRNREIMRDQKSLSKVVEELIQARSRAYASSTSGSGDNKDVLDLLMGAVDGKPPKAGLTSQHLRDNSFTILLAGHHTIASLLAWTMYMLALHPVWQERARTEVEEFCKGGEVEWGTLSKLKIITMLLQETMRLFPPVPLIGRLCLEENRIGPYTISEGLEILIPTAVLHRDKDLWGEDAEEFNPERFAKGIGKASKHLMAYLPFGFGPRTCVGQTLAMAEARAVLAVILTSFTWRLSPGYRHCPETSLTVHPKFDIPIIIERTLNSSTRV